MWGIIIALAGLVILVKGEVRASQTRVLRGGKAIGVGVTLIAAPVVRAGPAKRSQ
jgi:hypothetical protein